MIDLTEVQQYLLELFISQTKHPIYLVGFFNLHKLCMKLQYASIHT